MSDLLTICKSIFILINTVSVFRQNNGLNNQHIFYWKKGFDITKEYANPIYEGTFPVLECSTHLKNCLYNDEDFERFYRFCFKEQCSFGNYHCLNVNATTSLNLCGRLEDCNKRSRRIVLLGEINRTVDVYTVPCPDGAVQINLKKCFDPCIKDVAIVVQKPSSGNVPAIAYCNSAEGFCNPNKSMFFSTGSAFDECIDAELEGRCYNILDRLPDCSCVDKCPKGQVRSPLSNFTCSGEINNTTNIANKLTKTTPNSFPGQQPHTSIDAGELQKQGEESRQEQSSSISTLAIGLISGSVIVLAIAVLVGVICFSKQVQNQRSHGIQSNPVTYRIKHFYKVKNKTKVKTMLPEHNDREISDGQMCDDVVSSSASPSRPETIGAETSDYPDQQLNELKAPFLVGSQESAQRSTDSETEVLKPCSV